jgi:hypothetical protein
MARKAKRRYFPRRAAPRARPDDGERRQQLDAAAQQLLSQYTPEELRALLAERAARLEEADQAGTYAPGSGSLARYRAAQQAWELARRAVELARSEDGGSLRPP